jgi:hypothetical protein
MGAETMKVIIDRFEGSFAVVEMENKVFVNMPKSLVPASAKEGDVISIELDSNETEKRREKIEQLKREVQKI